MGSSNVGGNYWLIEKDIVYANIRVGLTRQAVVVTNEDWSGAGLVALIPMEETSQVPAGGVLTQARTGNTRSHSLRRHRRTVV